MRGSRGRLSRGLLAGCAALLLLALGGAPVMGEEGNRYGEPIICFGEDLGPYPPGPQNVWPDDTPNADAARECFFAHLCKAGTENLDDFPFGDYSSAIFDFGVMGEGMMLTSAVYQQPMTMIDGAMQNNFYGPFGPVMFSLVFPSPVKAVGFVGFDIGEGSQLTVKFFDHRNELIDMVDVPHTYPNAPSSTLLYFGYIRKDHPFSSVVFENSAVSSDLFLFDDITIGRKCKVGRGHAGD
jgi:hypothetical protein